MTYGDESVIKARLAAQAALAHTIKNEVVIDGCTYSFARREISSQISMVVPECFKPLAPEYAKFKYPYEDRPPIIITNQAGDTDFAFDFGIMPGISLNERIRQFKFPIKRLHPHFVFFSDRIETTPYHLKVASYDFRSRASDMDLYNLSFFADLPDTGMFGWFTCPIDLQEKWEQLVREMIQTIQILEQEQVENDVF